MSNPKYPMDPRPRRACGNYLGKQRRNFYLTNRSWCLLHALALEFGCNHSAIIELAVREKYVRDIGPVPPIKYDSGREAE